MTENEYIFTSESVSEGHPDKICDQISDAVVDYYLSNCNFPERARVACETMVTSNKVIIAGEVRGDGELENVDNNFDYLKDLQASLADMTLSGIKGIRETPEE